MPIDSLGNISGGYGGISNVGSSGGLILGGVKLPYSNLQTYLGSIFSIPGWSQQQNQRYNDTMTSYNAIEAANRRAQAQFAANQLKNYDAALAAQDAKDNTALQKLYGELKTLNPTDDFLGSQIGALSAAGVDSSVLTAYAAAGAKAGVDNYAAVQAQAQRALQAQQDYLDYIDNPVRKDDSLSGQDAVNSWYSDIASKDINGTYATGVRNLVADLVEQLSGIQRTRQEFQNQTNSLVAAAQIGKVTQTTKALMGIGEDTSAQDTLDAQADVAIGDTSHKETNTKSTSTALDSRGGGRYVTTTAKNASGLRI